MPIKTFVSVEYNGYSSIEEANARFLTFPAGEQHVTDLTALEHSQWDNHYAIWYGADSADYVALAMWVDAVKRRKVASQRIGIVIPYLPGARMDRGEPNGAAVYAGMINHLGADVVVTIDPHSDAMPMKVDNLRVVDFTSNQMFSYLNELGYTGVIAPDAGAIKRASVAAKRLGIPVYQGLKHRDWSTGELSHFSIEEFEILPNSRFLVVDDICDGGGTFKGLAAASGIPKDQLALYVTHGVFSNGAESLSDYFGAIYTTDSHPGSVNIPTTLVSEVDTWLLNHAERALR